MSKDNQIGLCKCPVCGFGEAAVRVSAKQLAYVICNSCNTQVFARSDKSDAGIRALITSRNVEPPVVSDVVPVPASPPDVVSVPAPPPVKKPSWGVLSG